MVLLLSGCASHAVKPQNPSVAKAAQAPSAENPENTASNVDLDTAFSQPTFPDPFESYNRAMFKFNDGLIHYIFKPVNKGYTFVVPSMGRVMIQNFFRNVQTVPDIINDLLQLNLHYMFRDMARLVVNSTIGLGGLFDVAAQDGIYAHQQSFGNTFSKWFVRDTPYFIVPVLGPGTVNDVIGLVPAYFASPLTYVQPMALRWSLGGLDALNIGSQIIPWEETFSVMSLDPYAAMRNAVMQAHESNMRYIDNDGSPPPNETYFVELPPVDTGS